eukprot:935565-Prymnesium_polylepis.1
MVCPNCTYSLSPGEGIRSPTTPHTTTRCPPTAFSDYLCEISWPDELRSKNQICLAVGSFEVCDM